ncbi:MAG: c-type cytochrome [Woeseia sp.]
MKIELLWTLLVTLPMLCTAAVAVEATPTPVWAVPKEGPESPQAPAHGEVALPGSALSLTQEQIDDMFNAPDWYPGEHKPMPPVVAHGNAPDNWACAMCHLASGNGHPQSAKLAGTGADYIVHQLAAFKAGDRQSYLGAFIDDLHVLENEKDAESAAAWFASLPVRKFQKVVEKDTVPETMFDGRSYMRVVKKDSDGAVRSEPLNGRIIEVPESYTAVKARDPHATFLTYVPIGSVEKGKEIATEGVEEIAACVTCHGVDLKGSALAPALAGAFPTYVVRQLYDFRNGKRKGLADTTGYMSAVSSQLSPEDIVNVAAYVGSLSP